MLGLMLALATNGVLAQTAPDRKYDGPELATFAALWEKGRADGNVVYGDENIRKVEYFIGFVNGTAFATRGRAWCSGEALAIGQISAIAAKFIREHPELWHLNPASLVERALGEVFPCSPTTTPRRK
jgi:hypothetical protein